MFKSINPSDYTISPFRANKFWSLSHTSEYVRALTGVRDESAFYESDARNEADVLLDNDGNPAYELVGDETRYVLSEDAPYYRNVYNLVYHLYYRHDSPFAKFGVLDYDTINLEFPTRFGSTIRVIKISNQIFGEQIRPGTVRLYSDKLGLEVVDDGKGNLVDRETEEHIGNVFYTNGMLVLTKEEEGSDQDTDDTVMAGAFLEATLDEAETGEERYYDHLFQFFNIEFRGQLTQYEHEIRCVIDPGEFSSSYNPTFFIKRDEIEEEKALCNERLNEGTGSDLEYCIDKVNKLEQIHLTPFITTVGLYNEDLELVAIGKLARPVQKTYDIPMSVVVRFDM